MFKKHSKDLNNVDMLRQITKNVELFIFFLDNREIWYENIHIHALSKLESYRRQKQNKYQGLTGELIDYRHN